MDGDVDERSIADVQASDLTGYQQVQLFAGLGGWPWAFRLANWPEEWEVWSGSCPCGPWSIAGKRKGFDDERHLWPHMQRLIAGRTPNIVFGEQVSKAPAWLGLVRSDMEDMDYALGVYPIEAASAGAEHYRDRYFFTGYRTCLMADEYGSRSAQPQGCIGEQRRRFVDNGKIGACGALADSECPRPFSSAHSGIHSGEKITGARNVELDRFSVPHSVFALADSDNKRSQEPERERGNTGTQQPSVARSDFRPLVDDPGFGWGEGWTESEFRRRGFAAPVASIGDCQYVECPDGKWRRLPPPGVRWLATGIPKRIPMLAALGNAIDPRPASAFIASFMDCIFDGEI